MLLVCRSGARLRILTCSTAMLSVLDSTHYPPAKIPVGSSCSRKYIVEAHINLPGKLSPEEPHLSLFREALLTQ